MQHGQCTYKRKFEARSRDHCCRGKAIIITYFECRSLALVMRHAMRVRQTIMWPVRLYKMFPHYLKKWQDFRF